MHAAVYHVILVAFIFATSIAIDLSTRALLGPLKYPLLLTECVSGFHLLVNYNPANSVTNGAFQWALLCWSAVIRYIVIYFLITSYAIAGASLQANGGSFLPSAGEYVSRSGLADRRSTSTYSNLHPSYLAGNANAIHGSNSSNFTAYPPRMSSFYMTPNIVNVEMEDLSDKGGSGAAAIPIPTMTASIIPLSLENSEGRRMNEPSVTQEPNIMEPITEMWYGRMLRNLKQTWHSVVEHRALSPNVVTINDTQWWIVTHSLFVLPSQLFMLVLRDHMWKSYCLALTHKNSITVNPIVKYFHVDVLFSILLSFFDIGYQLLTTEQIQFTALPYLNIAYIARGIATAAAIFLMAYVYPAEEDIIYTRKALALTIICLIDIPQLIYRPLLWFLYPHSIGLPILWAKNVISCLVNIHSFRHCQMFITSQCNVSTYDQRLEKLRIPVRRWLHVVGKLNFRRRYDSDSTVVELLPIHREVKKFVRNTTSYVTFTAVLSIILYVITFTLCPPDHELERHVIVGTWAFYVISSGVLLAHCMILLFIGIPVNDMILTATCNTLSNIFVMVITAGAHVRKHELFGYIYGAYILSPVIPVIWSFYCQFRASRAMLKRCKVLLEMMSYWTWIPIQSSTVYVPSGKVIADCPRRHNFDSARRCDRLLDRDSYGLLFLCVGRYAAFHMYSRVSVLCLATVSCTAALVHLWYSAGARSLILRSNVLNDELRVMSLYSDDDTTSADSRSLLFVGSDIFTFPL